MYIYGVIFFHELLLCLNATVFKIAYSFVLLNKMSQMPLVMAQDTNGFSSAGFALVSNRSLNSLCPLYG